MDVQRNVAVGRLTTTFRLRAMPSPFTPSSTVRGVPKNDVQAARKFDVHVMIPPTGCDEVEQCDVSSFGVWGRVTAVLLGSSDEYTAVALMM
jgi:hypothetical protein